MDDVVLVAVVRVGPPPLPPVCVDRGVGGKEELRSLLVVVVGGVVVVLLWLVVVLLWL